MTRITKQKNLYEELISQKQQGKVFTKEDLTHKILYQLCIVENLPDGVIGNIFGLTKNEVRYRRIKNDMENIFLKGAANMDVMQGYLEEHNIEYNEETAATYRKGLKIYAEFRGWNPGLVDKYLKEESSSPKEINKLDFDMDSEFVVEITDSTIEQSSSPSKSTKKSTGRKSNQKKTSASKIEAGKLGERIVLATERTNLKKKGLLDLAKKVKSVTVTEDKDITIDGLGYDIISYNEQGEPIFIEVKCSTTTNKNQLSFEISAKEVELMKGNLEGIDKEHAFIYYVYNLNEPYSPPKIEIIDYQKFQDLVLIPTSYKVTGTLINKKVNN